MMEYRLLCIDLDGTLLTDDKKVQYIHTEYLSPGTMREIYESIKNLGASLWIYRDAQWFVTAKNRFVQAEEESIQCMSELVSVEELLS